MTDLQLKISHLRNTLENTSHQNRCPRANILNNLCVHLIKQFEVSRSIVDINEAIKSAEEAIDSSNNIIEKAFNMSNIALALSRRYEVTNDMEDSRASIQKMQSALEIMPTDQPFRVEMLCLLGHHYRTQHQRTASKSSIEEAVRCFQCAVDRTSSDTFQWSRRSYHLGLALRDLYSASTQAADIERSVNVFEDILSHIDRYHAYWAKCYAGLGWSLLDQFGERQSEVDLRRAVDISQELVDMALTDDSQKAESLALSGSALYQLYLQKASSDSLQTSVHRQRHALAHTSPGTPLQAQRLNSLAVGLQHQYLMTGSVANFQEAIEYLKVALEMPFKEHPIWARLLHNLSEIFRASYLACGSFQDLQQALILSKQAAEAHLKGSRERLQSENSYAANLREKYGRTRSENDFKAALSEGLNVIQDEKVHNPDSAMYFNNLAALYRDRYLHAIRSEELDPRTIVILNEAIQWRQFVVEKTPKASGNRAGYLTSLAELYFFRYKEQQHDVDLENSIKYADLAVYATDKNHPTQARRLTVLGDGYKERYYIAASEGDLQEAFRCYARSLHHLCSPPLERIISGKRAADLAMKNKAWDDAARYLKECLELLPRVILKTNSLDDHLSRFQVLSMLGPISASVFLRAGKSALESLQALEKCRSIVASLVMNSRSDVSLLKEHDSDLYGRYCNLRAAVAETIFHRIDNGAMSMPVSPTKMASIALQNEQNVQELEKVEEEIRKRPGFVRFQLALTENELYELAQRGPIVSFNITEYGSHALIVTSKSIKALSLPRISQEDLFQYISSMPSGLNSSRDAKIKFGDIEAISSGSQEDSLRSLWEFCVEPVLKELGFLKVHKPDDQLPELWWVGGGLMTLLPLHAAGDCQLESPSNTIKHVVSSYATSLKALHFSRHKHWKPLKANNFSILIVAMPQTDGEKDLDTDREIVEIQRHIGSSAKIELLQRPSREEVVGRLPAHSVVHFACHGLSNSQYPDESGLLVGGEKVERLVIRDLQPINQQLAQLAYLSACSTAENSTGRFQVGDKLYLRGIHLIDEGIRLANTFQSIGFRHVIGTIWNASDPAAVAVAGKFYEHLIRNADSSSAISRALHEAVLSRRKTNNGSFDWAPFVHVGP